MAIVTCMAFADPLSLIVRSGRRVRTSNRPSVPDWKFDATAKVDDELCCSAELMCTYKEFD